MQNNSLTIGDMKAINELDDIITSGMLMSERKIKKKLDQHPWSRTLTNAILEVILWKLINSKLRIEFPK